MFAFRLGGSMGYRGKFLAFHIVLVGCLAAGSLECQTATSSLSLSKLPIFARPVAFQTPTPAPGQVAKPAKLNINVIGGAGAINDVKQRTPRDITVEIDDENDHPVEGAMVTFFSPNEGPGGSFVGDSHLLTVMTGSDGRAVAKDFRPNDIPGDYNIQVSVAYADQSATSTISQSNQVTPEAPRYQAFGHVWKKDWLNRGGRCSGSGWSSARVISRWLELEQQFIGWDRDDWCWRHPDSGCSALDNWFQFNGVGLTIFRCSHSGQQ